jgi:hypothetical protein
LLRITRDYLNRDGVAVTPSPIAYLYDATISSAGINHSSFHDSVVLLSIDLRVLFCFCVALTRTVVSEAVAIDHIKQSMPSSAIPPVFEPTTPPSTNSKSGNDEKKGDVSDCTTLSLLETAIEAGYTTDGEMFDINDYASLTRTCLRLPARVVDMTSDALVAALINRCLVMIAYDRDTDHYPCAMGGLRYFIHLSLRHSNMTCD